MKTGNTAYKAAVGLAIATPLLLVWMIGAVGVLGRVGENRCRLDTTGNEGGRNERSR